MISPRLYLLTVTPSVALGGFLMGFDASVISGAVDQLRSEFRLTEIELGWSVASLTLASTLAMLVSGPLSDRFGRVPVLKLAALLFLVSALACALAPSFTVLVVARMIGGLGVGAALIVAPMYIAEIAPAALRGRLVSINQLNIVAGISIAFFSNYALLQMASDGKDAVIDKQVLWRWMLGVEMLPAFIYLVALQWIPESPRWLMLRGRHEEALLVLTRFNGSYEEAGKEQALIDASINGSTRSGLADLFALFRPGLRLVLLAGLTVGVLQQITGINAVFFYAPLIFERSGFDTDGALLQAVLVGLVNLVFTVVAILTIDRIGRKRLLQVGLVGITLFMFLLAFSFSAADFRLQPASLKEVQLESAVLLVDMQETSYGNEAAFRAALNERLGDQATEVVDKLVSESMQINAAWVIAGILGFVACFAVSIGPVMWVLFSELFPNTIRGVAISFVGLVNSACSFMVQLVFPWELTHFGPTYTFFIYGAFAAVGLLAVNRFVPETRGQSLEEIEKSLVRRH
ncbi:MAG: sugar porter family MFS transporter [Pseudomonadota bacterium]